MLSLPRMNVRMDGWRDAVACALASGLGIVAAVLLWRRMAGAFTVSATPMLAGGATFLAAGLGLAAALVFVRRGAPVAGWQRVLPPAVALGPVLGIGLALTPPHSTLAVAGVTAAVLLTASAFFLAPEAFGLLPDDGDADRGADGVANGRAGNSGETGDPPWRIWPQSGMPPISPAEEAQILQWMTRRATDEGERIEGGLRVPFASGQRQATAHVAFCPPLMHVPVVHCEITAGHSARVKVAAVHPWGARIEIRRSGPVDAVETAEVEFSALAAAVTAAS